jgi:hypothetical protein
MYAAVADLLLSVATTLVALGVHHSRRRIRAMRIPTRLEFLVYIASCAAVVIPISIAASNSVQASSIGEGDPSLVLGRLSRRP